MTAHRTQKVQNAMSASKGPAVNAKAADVANAAATRAKKASDKISAAKVSQASKNTTNPQDDEIARLRAENARLRQASIVTNNTVTKIPRPPQDGNKSLQLRNVMGLAEDAKQYNAIRRSVKCIVDHAGLDKSLCWRNQPKEKIVNICLLAKEQHPYLDRFVHNWATEEFIKRLMKNRREYTNRLSRQSAEDKGNLNDEENRDEGERNREGEDNGEA